MPFPISVFGAFLSPGEVQATPARCHQVPHKQAQDFFELVDFRVKVFLGRALELIYFLMKVAGRVFLVCFSHSANSRRERFQAVKCTKSPGTCRLFWGGRFVVSSIPDKCDRPVDKAS